MIAYNHIYFCVHRIYEIGSDSGYRLGSPASVKRALEVQSTWTVPLGLHYAFAEVRPVEGHKAPFENQPGMLS